MNRVDNFVRSERAFASTELPRGERLESSRRPPISHFRREERQCRGPYGGDRRPQEGKANPSGRDWYSPYKPRERPPLLLPRNDHATRQYHNPPKLSLNSLTKLPREILATERQLRLPVPRPIGHPPRREDRDKYCDYHMGNGHHTNDCIQLRKQLETALESGKLNHLVKDVR